jgi:RimJ/RimL family protein N-acetyltransferase
MNAYKIETERLVIRCYEPKDAQKLKDAIDESLEHLMPWAKNEPETIEQKIARLKTFRGQFDLEQDYTFGIFDKEEKVLIGSTGLHTRRGEKALEIGYWIRQSQIKKGYALESTKALTKVGIEIAQKQRIEIHCEPNNLDSLNIPSKIGYTLEATLKNRTTGTDGTQKDDMVWTMFKEDYEKSEVKNFDIKVYDSTNKKIY